MVEDDRDFCTTCGRVVPEGSEHDFKAHGSTQQQADELREWKEALRKTGEHHTIPSIDGGTF